MFPKRLVIGTLICALGSTTLAMAEVHPPRILIDAPSEAVVGEPARISVLVSAEWGPDGPELETAGVPHAMRLDVVSTDLQASYEDRLRIGEDARGRGELIVTFASPGLQRVHLTGDSGASGWSAPIRVTATAPAQRVYWGDLHGYVALSRRRDAISPLELAEGIRESLEFGRHVSRLDFCAATPPLPIAGGLGNGAPGRTPWDEVLRVVEDVNTPGEFVAFPAFEWHGSEGRHTVIHSRPGPLSAPASFGELVRTTQAHGGELLGVGDAQQSAAPNSSRLGLEVVRGSREVEGLAAAAALRGERRAFLGGSASESGALGATGLTGVRADELTRDAILKAIRSGNTWATNGERIVVSFDVDVQAQLPKVRVSGVGTSPIDEIEIFRNGRLVSQESEFPDTEEFEFVFEDEDLLQLDCLDRTVAYHARIVQTSSNRYDPAIRDCAITTPIDVTLEPRHFDTAHARRGGVVERPPGHALVSLRDSWVPFRATPDRPLAANAPLGSFPAWDANQIDRLRRAAQDVAQLAARDSTLLTLSHATMPLAPIAEAMVAARDAQNRIDDATKSRRPTKEVVRELREIARRAHEESARAQTVSSSTNWGPLLDAWFAARRFAEDAAGLLPRVAEFAALPARSVPEVQLASKAPVSEFELAFDPRLVADRATETARARVLRSELEAHWGYTEPTKAGTEGPPVVRVRLRIAGQSATVPYIGSLDGSWAVAFERTDRGWVAGLGSHRLPPVTEPRLRLVFDQPTSLSHVYIEEPDGAPLPSWGRVDELSFDRAGEAGRATLIVHDDAVEVALLGTGAGASRVLWSGVLPSGRTSLAFAANSLSGSEQFAARWGFAGWSRTSGVVVPGHEIAKPAGFGAAPDGRAALAFADHLLLVDPYSGETERVDYPGALSHPSGSGLGIVALHDGLLVRGTNGGQGWVARYRLATATWAIEPPGPENGSIARHPDGGYAWLAGHILVHRSANGVDSPPLTTDAMGRLLGFDPAGQAVVAPVDGGVVRINPVHGGIVSRVPGTPIGLDATGAALLYEGLDASDPALARRVTVRRALSDGTMDGSFTLDFKASPVLDPPLAVAGLPDGSLLLLGGSTWWKREPEHTWWGASVEHFEPVWAGRTLVQNVHF